MKSEETLKQLFMNLAKCSIEVKADVIKRVSDWIESGGSLEDPYIVNQLQYTERHLELLTDRQKFDNQYGL